MRIGEVARKSGVAVATVRFYDGEGLLSNVTRRANGYRDFPAATPTRVRFIRRAQELGFTLREVRDFLRASDGRSTPGPRLAALAHAKLDELEGRVASLRRVQRAIRRVLEGGVKDGPCPIIESLGSPERLGAKGAHTTRGRTPRVGP